MYPVVLGAVLLFAATVEANPESPEPIVGPAKVIDGDTIEINEQRFDLYGADAPELEQICIRKGESWRCGEAAASALKARIGEQPIRCGFRRWARRNPENSRSAACSANGVDLSAWMVREGWAVSDPRRVPEYIEEEVAAKKARRGLWAGKFLRPREWRARQESAGNDRQYLSNEKLIRFDGLYQSQVFRGDAGKTRNFFRFYPDGLVMAASSTGTARQVSKWLRRGGTNSHGHGQYSLDGNHISFTIRYEPVLPSFKGGLVEYRGKVVDGRLLMKTKSHINYTTLRYEYDFVNIDNLR